MDEIIKINSHNWRRLKKKYVLTYYIIHQVSNMSEKLEQKADKMDKMSESGIQAFYNMFIDKENDTYQLVKKYERQSQGFFYSMYSTIRFIIDDPRIKELDEICKNYANTKSDSEFVQELVCSPFFGEFNDIKQKVLNIFFDEYLKWRKETFPSNVKGIMPKFAFNKQLRDRLDEEFSQEKKEIDIHEFERICNELEKKYNNG